jgi:signal transduction histidine kinase
MTSLLMQLLSRGRSPTSPRRALLLSIRGRITVLVTLMAVILLAPTGLIGGKVVHQSVANAHLRHTREQANLTAAAIRTGHLTDPIVPRNPGVDQVQVVTPNRRVLASSIAARGRPPMTARWPTPQDPQEDVRVCAHPSKACMDVSAVRVEPTPDSPVVYAVGRPVASAIPNGFFETLFTLQAAALVLLAAWATWKITGRTLRPVDAIRAELAAINTNDLSTRVPEPAGNDEIARLSRTINNTLRRLQHANERREHAKEQLEHANVHCQRTLDQQRRFVSDASHELRTPLAGLRTQLEEAQMHPDDTDLQSLLEDALGDVDRLQRIIIDLLLLATIDGNPPWALEETDLAELIRTEVARRADDHHAVRLDLKAGVMVNSVRTQISRLLANLLNNAQRHATSTVLIEVHDRGDKAELTVTDDGEGIAEADRERIFQRFTRLDAARSRDHGGAGLGLAIARGIAHAHHGALHVEDAPSGGARFVLRLPLLHDAAESASTATKNGPPASHKTPVSSDEHR